ncbi:MAG: DUF1036 domain-containing protein [Devosia sp.]
MKVPTPLFRMIAVATNAVVVMLFLNISPARADLRVCNQSSNQVSVALGYRADKGWQSEGWWVAAPAKCAVVYQGDLHSRFFYLYVADDIGGGAWNGTNFLCTRDESFTIFGVEDCLARGYERTGFFEVDTQNKTNWTLKLTDAPALPPSEAPPPGPIPDTTGSNSPTAETSGQPAGDLPAGDPGSMD